MSNISSISMRRSGWSISTSEEERIRRLSLRQLMLRLRTPLKLISTALARLGCPSTSVLLRWSSEICYSTRMTSRVLRVLIHCLSSKSSNLILSTTLMKMFLSLLLSSLDKSKSPLSKLWSASIFWLTLSVFVPPSVRDREWCICLRSTAVCLCMEGTTTQFLRIMIDLPVRICCRSYRKLCTAWKCGRFPSPSTRPLIKVTHILTSGIISWSRIRFTICIYWWSHCFKVTPVIICSRRPIISSTLCILYEWRL